MGGEMSERQIALLKKKKATEKVKNILNKMVSYTADKRPIITSQITEILPKLRQAEKEYQKATKEFLDTMLE